MKMLERYSTKDKMIFNKHILSYNFEVNSGTTSCKSPTIPKSAIYLSHHSIHTLNKGASGSLLIHTIVCESFIPAWCWMDPLTPHPIYNEGAIVLPVCPTCKLASIISWSTTARVPPTIHYLSSQQSPAACSLSAKSKMTLNWSFFPTPRPPTTTRSACTSSGLFVMRIHKSNRSDLVLCSSWKVE